MTDQKRITLEEALFLVDFEFIEEAWRVKNIRGNLSLSACFRDAFGVVRGTIDGRQWQFVETPRERLERLIKEGSNVLREVSDLQEGLRETVKAVAEELEIKPSIINKAIKIAHKDEWAKHEEEWEEIEGILGITKNLPGDHAGE